MKNFRAHLCRLLVIAMLAGTFASCSDTSDGKEQQTSNDTTASVETTTAADETESDKILPNLPEMDFEGYTFKGLVRGYSNTHWYTRDFYAAETTGEYINDAVWERNETVTSKYNFKIKQLDGQELGGAQFVRSSVQSGANEIDLIAGIQDQGPLVTEGYYLDLEKIEYMDLSQPWYDQNARESLSIGGSLYLAVSDLCLMDKDATWGVLFNKDMAEELMLDNFYEMAENGTWTMDAMRSAMEVAANDLDGNGEMDVTDRWGLASEQFNTTAFMIGAGARVVVKDDNDMPTFDILSDRYIAAYEKAFQLNATPSTTLIASDSVSFDTIDDTFTEGRSLFYFTGMNRVPLLRNMDDNFGILPAPKYNEEQESYYDVVSCANAAFIAIPKSVDNSARSGFITEALSAESKYTVIPAYYETTLRYRDLRDSESAAMLDIIFASRVFDLGNLYSWGYLFTMPGAYASSGLNEITSQLTSLLPSAEAEMQQTINTIITNAAN